MKKIILFLIAATFVSQLAFAFESDVTILSEAEITKLSSPALISAYIDVNVEIEAAKAFHTTSGFMPKEYKTFKDLLRYRILLINEMKKRKLEVPQVE